MLTELEGAVLSVLARRQPLSAYGIRKEFEAAVTRSWSASAGSVYPLVKRLTKRIVNRPAQYRVVADPRTLHQLTVTTRH